MSPGCASTDRPTNERAATHARAQLGARDRAARAAADDEHERHALNTRRACERLADQQKQRERAAYREASSERHDLLLGAGETEEHARRTSSARRAHDGEQTAWRRTSSTRPRAASAASCSTMSVRGHMHKRHAAASEQQHVGVARLFVPCATRVRDAADVLLSRSLSKMYIWRDRTTHSSAATHACVYACCARTSAGHGERPRVGARAATRRRGADVRHDMRAHREQISLPANAAHARGDEPTLRLERVVREEAKLLPSSARVSRRRG